MERISILLILSVLLALTSPMAQADDANAQAAPADPIRELLAQATPWGGGAGPRQRDCQRLCENEQVNCQRGCFGLLEMESQGDCSRQCLTTYLRCAEGCRPGSTGGAGDKAKADNDKDESSSG